MSVYQEKTYDPAPATPILTIGEIVATDYRKAEIFRKHGLDYSCAGNRSLEDACRSKGIDPRPVQSDLDSAGFPPGESANLVENWPLDVLAEHIVARHHRYITESLPILFELTGKLVREQGDRYPELHEISWDFHTLFRELQTHLQKEEYILFPYIVHLAAAERQNMPCPVPFFGSVIHPVRSMEAEHAAAGNRMENIRRLSNNFTPPIGACTAFGLYYARLQEFERDLHRHFHLENNVLFPKAIALEQRRVHR